MHLREQTTVALLYVDDSNTTQSVVSELGHLTPSTVAIGEVTWKVPDKYYFAFEVTGKNMTRRKKLSVPV